ncbi:hypothetical protein ARAM_006762 [Aspergillus rambellii]|uniref:NWD NACHT-NTPase N-terminal domain-containing protein n=1 Tax=Aspergillus rambellii TaxID=308745 RepID=A0A0F8UHA9_9EURO|nr:hypothetical protein ARAM_006762 [Aspergillus rambellii]
MAGISLILPLLKNPATVEAANKEGLTYVTSQMRYYVEMDSLLLPQDLKPSLRNDLSERVIGLYKAIINFQLRSVLRFYRSRTKSYFRDVINYDSWDGQLGQLQKQEAELDKQFKTVLSGTSVEQLKKLATEAKELWKRLDYILRDIQKQMQELVSIAQKNEERLCDAEDRRCLERTIKSKLRTRRVASLKTHITGYSIMMSLKGGGITIALSSCGLRVILEKARQC